ncbi:hypothetical protein [Limnohabitans sp.]|jgi:hypothetical protein|uniref:hypothetical protein n=1 Tax=Limnohabitans sp. TaxID=1907725 RepID=UPI0037BFBDBE
MNDEKLTNSVMNEGLHKVITLFQQSAESLELQKSGDDLDDAISLLSLWIHLNAHELTEDDFLGLILIGGILYRQVQRRDTSHQKPTHCEVPYPP